MRYSGVQLYLTLLLLFTWGTDQGKARRFFYDPPHREAYLDLYVVAPHSGVVIVLLLPHFRGLVRVLWPTPGGPLNLS